MNWRWFKFFLRCWSFSVLLQAVLLTALQAATTPDGFVETQIDVFRNILKLPKKEQLPALRQQFATAVDFTSFAKESLGEYWQKISAKEQESFTELLKELLETKYLQSFKGEIGKEKIVVSKYNGSVPPAGLIQVLAKLKQTDLDIDLIFKLKAVTEGFRLYDVQIDEVSILDDYRYQFTTFLKKKTIKDLLAKLKSKIAEYRAS